MSVCDGRDCSVSGVRVASFLRSLTAQNVQAGRRTWAHNADNQRISGAQS